jgi:hypothetical protein
MSEERRVQDDPVVLEGEDEVPREDEVPLDPYTPEPARDRASGDRSCC